MKQQKKDPLCFPVKENSGRLSFVLNKFIRLSKQWVFFRDFHSEIFKQSKTTYIVDAYFLDIACIPFS